MILEVFSDGASSGNPGRGGWGAIIIGPERVIELAGAASQVTNNQMEIQAALGALSYIAREGMDPEKVNFYTDSKYLIDGITRWIFGWQKTGWKTASGADVKNKELWQELFVLSNRDLVKTKINWLYVPAHSGNLPNERADFIAQSYSKAEDPPLINGSLSSYQSETGINYSSELRTFAASRKGKAYSYLSMVDGKVHRHRDWDSCSKRVKGKSNVKYRKTLSPEDEREIVEKWGMRVEDIRE